MTRRLVPAILAMAAIVAASNILVQFLLGPWLTWGALTYPFAFLVTDVTNRVWGPAMARRVVFAGFLTGILCSFVAAAFAATTFRIALGSGIAFLTAQLLDIAVFERLRRRSWWQAPFLSSLVGSAVDTVLFFSVAFAAVFAFLDPAADTAWATVAVPLLGHGPDAPLWVSLALADWGVKLLLALVALLPFRLIVGRLLARVA